MVKVIVGTMGRSPFAKTEAISTPAQFEAFLGACQSHGVKELDTARVYSGGENERLLGEVNAGKQFQVSTKINITGEGALKRDSIFQSADESFASLKEQAVDIFYIHRPDRSVPMEETCSAINDLYQQGKFKRFGICSYAAKEVEEMHALCKAKGYVLPSVYQGNYNPLARRPETELFPTLRRLGIHFYGFGPLAGGLLAKPAQDMRFDVPTVGPDTVEAMRAAGGRVLAVEAGRTILIDEAETVARADRYGIAIVARADPG